jgi:hypothetical protein
MKPPGWKWLAAMSVLVLGIVVSVSGAATSGSKSNGGGSDSDRRGPELRVDGPPGEHLETLADELGVSQDKLREAFEAVRDDVAPRPLRKLRPPSRAQMEEHCKDLTDALGKELGKSGDEVRDAIKAAAKKDIEQAVDDGDLTRKQADEILSKIDDADCAPMFAFKAGIGPGCGGPGGPPERFEHRLPPPGESDSEGSSTTVAPVPFGAPA